MLEEEIVDFLFFFLFKYLESWTVMQELMLECKKELTIPENNSKISVVYIKNNKTFFAHVIWTLWASCGCVPGSELDS